MPSLLGMAAWSGSIANWILSSHLRSTCRGRSTRPSRAPGCWRGPRGEAATGEDDAIVADASGTGRAARARGQPPAELRALTAERERHMGRVNDRDAGHRVFAAGARCRASRASGRASMDSARGSRIAKSATEIRPRRRESTISTVYSGLISSMPMRPRDGACCASEDETPGFPAPSPREGPKLPGETIRRARARSSQDSMAFFERHPSRRRAFPRRRAGRAAVPCVAPRPLATNASPEICLNRRVPRPPSPTRTSRPPCAPRTSP